MSDFGLTTDGFLAKRLQDIKSDLEDNLRAAFGDVDVDASSVFGQLVGVFSRPLADVWELGEAVYLSQSPTSAEGIQLDEVVAYTGLERRAATKSRAQTILYTEDIGSMPVTVPALVGTAPMSVSTAGAGDVFELGADTDIDDSVVVDATVEVTGAVSGKQYTVTVNGTDFDYTAAGPDDEAMIADALKDAINLGAEPVTASTDGLDAGKLQVRADDQDTPTTFTLAVSEDGSGTNIELFEVGSPAVFWAAESGRVVAPAGTLTVIETPVTGLDRVDNLNDATPGAENETDAELRLRREESLGGQGKGTLEAIRARILDEVENVTACSIFENNTEVDLTPTGLPPHSFECVVTGGDNQDIADMIWNTKPAGIQTWGDITETVIDTNGDPQPVKFARPTEREAYVKVVYEVYDEESYPGETEAVAAIKASILAYGDTFRIGQDMIRDRFYTPIYTAGVDGIGAIATLEIALDSPPSWQTTDIEVGPDEIAMFADSRLDVSEAP